MKNNSKDDIINLLRLFHKNNFRCWLINFGLTTEEIFEELICDSLGDMNVFSKSKKYIDAAEARGLKVRYFAGDALHIETANGSIDELEGYIIGNQMLVRADSANFTAEQLTRHEIGHDMIAKGEVNVDKVVKRIKEIFKTEEDVDQVAKYYEEAYRGTGLKAEEIWEEVICDSLGDMNIFAKSSSFAKAAQHMGMTIESVQQAVAETKTEATNPKAEAEGKASRDFGEYAEKQYNNFGWVRANDVVNEGYWNNFTRNYADAVHNKNFDLKTDIGEYMIAVYDESLSEREQVIDHIVFASGNIKNPNVSRIIRIYEIDEQKLDKYRRNIYDFERRGVQQTTGELFELYRKTDFGAYDQEDYSGKVAGYSQRLGTDRSGSSKATSKVKEYIFETDEDNVTGKFSRKPNLIDNINELAGEESDAELTKSQKVAKVRGELERMNVDKGSLMALTKVGDKLFDLYGGESSISEFRYGMLEATKLALDSKSESFDKAYEIVQSIAREVAYNPKNVGGDAELLREIKAEIRGSKMAVRSTPIFFENKSVIIYKCRKQKEKNGILRCRFFVRRNYFAAASVFAMISSPL